MKKKNIIIVILFAAGCGAIILTLVLQYVEENKKKVQQDDKTQPRTSIRKLSKEAEQNTSVGVSAKVLSYGELYTKVIDRSPDTLTVVRIDPVTSEPIGMETYIIRIDKETAFVYQKASMQNGKIIFTPEKGSLDTIQKGWYVKLRYEPEKFFPPGIEYGNREGVIIPQEIMYSELSPFQP